MLDWSATFLVIAIVNAVLGFTSITGPVIEIAQIFSYIFLFLSASFYILGRKRVPLSASAVSRVD